MVSKEEIQKKYTDLKNRLSELNEAYHRHDISEVSDEKYDSLFKELIDLENKYAFLVPKDCNKNTIKKAVELKFDVKVIKVSTLNQIGKQKQMTIKSGGKTIRTSGTRSSFKKAIVTLNEEN